MADTDTLTLSDHAQWELVLVIEGISIGFASDSDLQFCDSGDGRAYKPGLVRKGLAIRKEIDDYSGRIVPNQQTFQIEDHDETLATLFSTDDSSVTYLESEIEPGDDLSALTEFYDKHIGHEKIGSAGERRQYPVPLGDTIGMHHHTIFDDSNLPIQPPPVSDKPVLWKGRRCALYRVFRDHIGDASLRTGMVFEPDLETLIDRFGGGTGTSTDTAYDPGTQSRISTRTQTGASIDWSSPYDPTSADITVSMWVKWDDYDDSNRAFRIFTASALSGYLLTCPAGGYLAFYHFTSGGTSMFVQSTGSAVPAAEWHHIAASYDGSGTATSCRLYVDGQEVSYLSQINGTSLRNPDGVWEVISNEANKPPSGRVRDVKAWDRILTAAEILTEYQTPNGYRPSSEWVPIWWGSLRDDGTVRGRKWTITADGLESWTQKDLGQLYQRETQNLEPEISYDDLESYISVRIVTHHDVAAGGTGFYGSGIWTQQFTATDIVSLRQEFATALTTIAQTAGTDGAWAGSSAAVSGGNLSADTGTGAITFTKGINVAVQAVAIIGIHKRFWGHFGYDLGAKNYLGVYERTTAGEEWTDWPDDSPILNAGFTDGYVALKITLSPPEGPIVSGNDDEAVERTVVPDYPGGVVSLDPNAITTRGQVADIEAGQAIAVAHYGQLIGPVASDPEDNTAPWPAGAGVNRMGFWLMEGKIRFANTEDAIDEAQVLKASWIGSSGLVSGGEIVMTQLSRPNRFGIARPKLSKPWNGTTGQITARPLIVLGWRARDDYDEADRVMLRILLSSGTSTGWDAPAGGSANLDPGDNQLSFRGVVYDGEVADLGLRIPASMVQDPSLWFNEGERVGDARWVKVSAAPGENSEEIMHAIMAPLGWAWSLRNGQYGIFTPFAPIEEEQVDVAITRASVDRKQMENMVVPQQSIREYAPIDVFKVGFSRRPYTDDFRFERKFYSLDRGRRYRPGGITEDIDAPYYHRAANTKPIERRLQQKAKFWERRHFSIEEFPLLPSVARQIEFPGHYIRYTHPIPADPMLGTYGITGRRGVVTAVEEDLSRDSPGHRFSFLIHADRSIVPKLHCFTARGYGYDSTNKRILIHDNWLAIEYASFQSDAAKFVEPTYVGVAAFGGSARIKWFQPQGSTWSETGTAVVTAVNTTQGQSYIEFSAGFASGTYYACREAILMPDDISTQDAAWVLQLYAAIGDEDGEYSMGNTTSLWEDVP